MEDLLCLCELCFYISIILFMSFSELKFKWSFHVIGSLSQVHVISILDFPTVSHLKSMTYLYHGSEKCKTSHATTNMTICMPAEISTYCNA